MDLEALRREFNSKARLYEQLRVEALFIIEPAIANANIKIHSITSRVKTVVSFLDKVQRKQSENPFEIKDIVGVRVICLFLSDIERIGRLIRESFIILDEDNKVEGTDVSSFGYMSVHFIAQMKREHAGPRYDPIAGIPLEIQVRTIAMDAWANVSHYLDYKSDKDVPSDLRRDFYALSGLFYVADRHFEMFFRSSERSREKMVIDFGAAEPPIHQEINLDSLSAYLRNKFPDRKDSDPKFISELITELSKMGIKSIAEVDSAISMAIEAFEMYEKDDIPAGGEKYFNTVGAVRGMLFLANERYRKEREKDAPKENLEKLSRYINLIKK